MRVQHIWLGLGFLLFAFPPFLYFSTPEAFITKKSHFSPFSYPESLSSFYTSVSRHHICLLHKYEWRPIYVSVLKSSHFLHDDFKSAGRTGKEKFTDKDSQEVPRRRSVNSDEVTGKNKTTSSMCQLQTKTEERLQRRRHHCFTRFWISIHIGHNNPLSPLSGLECPHIIQVAVPAWALNCISTVLLMSMYIFCFSQYV